MRLCNVLVALGLAAGIAAAAPVEPPPRAAVFYVTDTAALAAGRVPNPSVVRRMVDQLVVAVTGKPTPAEAWASLVKKTDTVGIKVAAAGGKSGGTRAEVALAIAEGLGAIGIPRDRVVIWDRQLSDLLAAGFRKDDPRYRLVAIDPATGYDKKSEVTAPVLGKLIWGDSGFDDRSGGRFADLLESGDQLSSRSYYARILTKDITRIINVPALTDSFLTGVNGALANVTLPNLDNWRRFTKPPAFGDPYLAEIYADGIIRDKVALTILDGLIAQYAGGPFPNPGFTVDQFTLYASKDPVALDATAMRLLDELRRPSKLPPLGPMTLWLESAQGIGLGLADPDRIDLIRAPRR